MAPPAAKGEGPGGAVPDACGLTGIGCIQIRAQRAADACKGLLATAGHEMLGARPRSCGVSHGPGSMLMPGSTASVHAVLVRRKA